MSENPLDLNPKGNLSHWANRLPSPTEKCPPGHCVQLCVTISKYSPDLHDFAEKIIMKI
jgi:hypothetical protein